VDVILPNGALFAPHFAFSLGRPAKRGRFVALVAADPALLPVNEGGSHVISPGRRVAQLPAAVRTPAAHVIVPDLSAPEVDDADRHHLASVLRLRPGEAVGVTDGRGGWRQCSFLAGGGLRPESDVVRGSRRAPAVTIGMAPVKGDRPEWAVQKLTELGVDRILLLTAARSVVRWEPERARRHLEKFRLVARQAAMQSRQVWLPEITGLEPAQAVAGQPGVALAAPGGGPPSLDYPTVLVGPEGGWTDVEQESAQALVSLGPSVLRTESAAVAAGVLLSALRAGLVRSG
jgi:16S rRNA (uracil1498-N3)-methyltransferase